MRPDPASISNRREFARPFDLALTELRAIASLTVREAAKLAGSAPVSVDPFSPTDAPWRSTTATTPCGPGTCRRPPPSAIWPPWPERAVRGSRTSTWPGRPYQPSCGWFIRSLG